jgi:xanthine dehydrogenase accessory factor
MKSIFTALVELEERGEAGVLCSIIRSQGSTPRHVGSKMLVYPDGHFIGTIGGGELEQRVLSQALEALEEGKTKILVYDLSEPEKGDPGVCGGRVEVFLEPILPQPKVVVVGGGHVGKAVASLAHWLGFSVIVSDDRPEFSTPESIPDGDDYHAGPMAALPDEFRIDRNSYLILCTRNVTIDVAGLPALLDTEAAYIGIIGSRRRWETTRRQLLETGLAEPVLDRVISPMGLELNAETPEEIAVSILAEIIMLRRGGDGKRMGV